MSFRAYYNSLYFIYRYCSEVDFSANKIALENIILDLEIALIELKHITSKLEHANSEFKLLELKFNLKFDLLALQSSLNRSGRLLQNHLLLD